MRHVALALGALLAWAGCTEDRATEAAPDADARSADATRGYALFRERVAPILAASCSGAPGEYACHAQPPETLDLVGGGGHPDAMSFFFPVSAETGRLETDEQLRGAYDALMEPREVRGSMVARVDPAVEPRFSMALRKPLSETAGGTPHLGGDVFASRQDAGYRTLRDWIALEGEERDAEEVPLEGGDAGRFFKEEALPVLARNTCLSPACHEFNHSSFRFDPGVAPDDPEAPLTAYFDNRLANQNRRSALGIITPQLHLTGDVAQSRFMAKALPLDEGGVLHKGGNDAFFDGRDDPDFQTLVEWARLERRALLDGTHRGGEPVSDAEMGRVRGVVFVRRPRDLHRRYLDPGRYLPGGDLWLLPVREGETLETAEGPAVNLTARFHPGEEADVREPDVRYDGRAVVFSMRVGEDDRLNVYELELTDDLEGVDGSLRRLTWGPADVDGVPVHFTDPTYVPAAEDERALVSGKDLSRADVVFASNLAGEVAPAEEYGVLGEVDGGDGTTLEDWERREADGSYVGRRVFVLGPDGASQTRHIVGFENHTDEDPAAPTRLVLDAPLSPVPEPGAHYVIDLPEGRRAEPLPAYSVYGLPQPPRGEEQRHFEQALARVTHSPNHELDLSVRGTGEVYFASLRNTGYARHRPVFNVGRNRRQLDKAFSFPTHRGNRSRLRIYADYHELPGGHDVFVAQSPDSLWGSGALYLGDHQLGCMFEFGNPVDGACYLWEGYGKPGSGDRPSHPRAVPVVSELFTRFGPDAVTDHGWSPGGTWADVRPLPDGSLLASRAPGPLDLRDPDAAPDFDLAVVHGEAGFYGAPGGLGLPSLRVTGVPAANTPDHAELQAVPVMVRFKERMRGAKREADDRYLRPPGSPPDERPATFCEKNYRVIDAFIEDNIPNGKHVTYERDPVTGERLGPEERVAYVRIVEGLPWTADQFAGVDPARVANGDPQSTRVSNGIHPAKRIVAEVPLDEDGGVCFPIPSDTPYVYQSLNADRMALRSLKRWFFASPGEYFATSVPGDLSFQQCAVCHGSMTGDPRDAYGPMDKATPGGCGGACHVERDARRAGLAFPEDEPPEDPAAPPVERLMAGEPLLDAGERVPVTFRDDVQPLLDRHCVACHRGRDAAAGLDLRGTPTAYYSRSYEALMALEDPASRNYEAKRYVSERQALAIESYLVEKLYGRELKARRALEGDAPHPSPGLIARSGAAATPLDEAGRLTFVRWIDLGAVFRMPEDGR